MEKKISPKKLIGYICTGICVILIAYIIIAVIDAKQKNKVPSIFGVSISYVPTDSMKGTIEAGDYVLFTNAKMEDCNLDDIVVYYNQIEKKNIIHRVIGVVRDGQLITNENYKDYISFSDYSTDYLITKGDNNLIADTIKVDSTMVYGKYVTTVGFMKIFSGGIDSSVVFMLLFLIFAVIVAVQVVQIVLKHKTEETRKKNEEAKIQRDKMLEELKQQILKEELEKLKNPVSSEDENKEDLNETNKEDNNLDLKTEEILDDSKKQ